MRIRWRGRPSNCHTGVNAAVRVTGRRQRWCGGSRYHARRPTRRRRRSAPIHLPPRHGRRKHHPGSCARVGPPSGSGAGHWSRRYGSRLDLPRGRRVAFRGPFRIPAWWRRGQHSRCDDRHGVAVRGGGWRGVRNPSICTGVGDAGGVVQRCGLPASWFSGHHPRNIPGRCRSAGGTDGGRMGGRCERKGVLACCASQHDCVVFIHVG